MRGGFIAWLVIASLALCLALYLVAHQRASNPTQSTIRQREDDTLENVDWNALLRKSSGVTVDALEPSDCGGPNITISRDGETIEGCPGQAVVGQFGDDGKTYAVVPIIEGAHGYISGIVVFESSTGGPEMLGIYTGLGQGVLPGDGTNFKIVGKVVGPNDYECCPSAYTVDTYVIRSGSIQRDSSETVSATDFDRQYAGGQEEAHSSASQASQTPTPIESPPAQAADNTPAPADDDAINKRIDEAEHACDPGIVDIEAQVAPKQIRDAETGAYDQSMSRPAQWKWAANMATEYLAVARICAEQDSDQGRRAHWYADAGDAGRLMMIADYVVSGDRYTAGEDCSTADDMANAAIAIASIHDSDRQIASQTVTACRPWVRFVAQP